MAKPEIKLTKTEEREVKKVARELLEILKREKLVSIGKSDKPHERGVATPLKPCSMNYRERTHPRPLGTMNPSRWLNVLRRVTTAGPYINGRLSMVVLTLVVVAGISTVGYAEKSISSFSLVPSTLPPVPCVPRNGPPGLLRSRVWATPYQAPKASRVRRGSGIRYRGP